MRRRRPAVGRRLQRDLPARDRLSSVRSPGSACVPSACGDSVREGAEQCDDGNTSAGDGCTARPVSSSRATTVRPPARRACPPCAATAGPGPREPATTATRPPATAAARPARPRRSTTATGAPSDCRPLIEFVAIRRFTVSNVSPDGLVYDPLRRSFGGHKQAPRNKPIELCLDGTIIDPNDTTAGVARNHLPCRRRHHRPVAAELQQVPRPVQRHPAGGAPTIPSPGTTCT